MSIRFIKLILSDKVEDLIKNHQDAFMLLMIIAKKARRESFNGLDVGQAQMGDYEEYGFTRSRYRTSLAKLEKFGMVSQQVSQQVTSKLASKQAILTLCNPGHCDIGIIDVDQQVTSKLTSKRPVSEKKKIIPPNDISNPPSEKEKTDKDNDQFDIFWECYPRKQGKKKALISWGKIKFNGQLKVDQIIESVKQHMLLEWNDKSDEFIPYPATYLHQERWNDELTVNTNNNNGKASEDCRVIML